jgi:hypothetical protein
MTVCLVLLRLLGGFSVGYLIASLIESYLHQHVSDAPNRTVKVWERHPRLFHYLLRTRFSHHVVHHRRTFKQDFVTQFRSEQERAALDEQLLTSGSHGEIIRRSQYAVRLHGSGSLVFIAPLLPVAPLSFLAFGAWGTAGACAALALPPLFSHFIHPYLHCPHEKALQEAPALTGWLLKRRYFRAMARNHFMHHRYVASNFNLVLGGDRLRFAHRKPSEIDLQDMQRLGLRVD